MVSGVRDPQVRPLFAAVLLLLSAGALFYTLVERWTVIDALYFCVVTLTTVGYGDLAPETDLGKLFTIVYVLAGVGLILLFVNTILSRAIRIRADELEAKSSSRTASQAPGERDGTRTSDQGVDARG